MQNQRRDMTSNGFQLSAQADQDNDWSQALLPGASGSSMPPFTANQVHPNHQTSYDSSLDPFNYGPQHMSAPWDSASQFDPAYQPSFDSAFDSMAPGAYDTAALTPNFALDQQLNAQAPSLATPWDSFAMQLPNTSAALPLSTANDQSNVPLIGTLGFQGWDQSGFASPPTGTSSLPASYDPHRLDNELSWLDPAFQLSPADPASANDIECMTTWPTLSTTAGMTE